MVVGAFVLLAAAAQLVNAHFGIEYPKWRADTLSSSTNFSQWDYPCAGAPTLPDNERTPWPLTGGSVKLDLHHKWTYVFINLGLGENVTNFNYTLTPGLWNSTGNGTLCVQQLTLPTNLPIVDGSKASLQFVTSGDSGSALYNCADIVFKANATTLSSSECVTDAGVKVAPVVAAQQKSGASTAGLNKAMLSSAAGLAVVFAFGLSL
ncbi:hypothetical protein B0H63DRAFT_388288 [Podospora didyma]|uniref:Copper acquisition factor BIM1-like domain-containing protein n=1 Tax=Podospora didyma TaxID=330526 RepID=A0AAE0U707_9PEZI|nr:hypothetical protein B0H63DRAFT_388288 [Podospora didyma]